MTSYEKAGASVSSVLQELEAVRNRMDQASDWYCSADGSMRAAALAQEVGRLVREASLQRDDRDAALLLAMARRLLDELQILLGVH